MRSCLRQPQFSELEVDQGGYNTNRCFDTGTLCRSMTFILKGDRGDNAVYTNQRPFRTASYQLCQSAKKSIAEPKCNATSTFIQLPMTVSCRKKRGKLVVPSPRPILQDGGRTAVSVMKNEYLSVYYLQNIYSRLLYLSLEAFCLESRRVFSTRQIPSPERDNLKSICFDTNCPCNRHHEPIIIKVSL